MFYNFFDRTFSFARNRSNPFWTLKNSITAQLPLPTLRSPINCVTFNFLLSCLPFALCFNQLWFFYFLPFLQASALAFMVLCFWFKKENLIYIKTCWKMFRTLWLKIEYTSKRSKYKVRKSFSSLKPTTRIRTPTYNFAPNLGTKLPWHLKFHKFQKLWTWTRTSVNWSIFIFKAQHWQRGMPIFVQFATLHFSIAAMPIGLFAAHWCMKLTTH